MTAVTASNKLHIIPHLCEISGNGLCADRELICNFFTGNLGIIFYALKDFLLHIRQLLGDILRDTLEDIVFFCKTKRTIHPKKSMDFD